MSSGHGLGQICRLPARGDRGIFFPFRQHLDRKELEKHDQNKKYAEKSGLYVFHKIPLPYFCFLVLLVIFKHIQIYFSIAVYAI